MRKLLLLCTCLVLLCAGAFAQKGGEAYFGYSTFTSGKNGWNGDVGINVAKTFMVEGDLGGYYSHNNTIHSFMGGVKVQSPVRSHGFTPWGHFLFGGSHVHNLSGDSDTARSWALGGGVDAKVYKKIALRLTADVFHTRFYDNGDLHLRAGAGFVYRF
jgi:opacity protein-like surface antigen